MVNVGKYTSPMDAMGHYTGWLMTGSLWFKEIIPTELGRISSPTTTLNNQGPFFIAQLDGMSFDPSRRVMFCILDRMSPRWGDIGFPLIRALFLGGVALGRGTLGSHDFKNQRF